MPVDRRARVALRPLLSAVNNDKLLKAFGITVSDKPISVPAKILPTPVIQYGGSTFFAV